MTSAHSYVELDASCTGRNCSVARIRESIQAHPPKNWTFFDQSEAAVMHLSVLADFGTCSSLNQQPTPLQRYFTRPEAAYNSTQEDFFVSNLTKEAFALRWAQILNASEIAGMGMTTIPSKLPGNKPGGVQIPSVIPAGMAVKETHVNVMDGELVLVCNTGWLAALLVASFIMFLLGVWGVVWEKMRKGPHVAMNISSMTRDNPFVNAPPGGTAMDAAERMRKLGSVRVRLADICADNDVGYIAISTYSNEQFVDTMHDHRLYA